MRRRLDVELVRRGLVASREQARTEIDAGRVRVMGAVADKSSRLVAPSEPLVVVGPPPRYVSRGGEKLEAALGAFSVDVAGKDALDAGASTGGFTDCLLQHGAGHVFAVDVGHGQLHERLQADRRVTPVERTNIRYLTLERLGRLDRGFPLIVADLSFISLRTVASALMGLAAPEADMIVLVKPQFEAGRDKVSKGKGVIDDPEIWQRAVDDVRSAFESAGAAMIDVIMSPIRGGAGNTEFLAHFHVGAAPAPGGRRR